VDIVHAAAPAQRAEQLYVTTRQAVFREVAADEAGNAGYEDSQYTPPREGIGASGRSPSATIKT
jgi:hypothetical protein